MPAPSADWPSGGGTAEARLLVDKRASTQAILDRLSWLMTGACEGEYVHHEVNGLLFEHRSPSSLSKQMQRFVDAPSLAATLGARGYVHSEDGDVPDIHEHVRQVEEVYQQVLRRRDATRLARRSGRWRVTFETNPETCNLHRETGVHAALSPNVARRERTYPPSDTTGAGTSRAGCAPYESATSTFTSGDQGYMPISRAGATRATTGTASPSCRPTTGGLRMSTPVDSSFMDIGSWTWMCSIRDLRAPAMKQGGRISIAVVLRRIQDGLQLSSPSSNGHDRVERFDGGLEVIDEAGRSVVELRPALCSEFASSSGDMVGFWRTQTIATAVELGVFGALPASEVQVARWCGLRADRAGRLLRALAELSLVSMEGATWCTTPRGDFLREEHALTPADTALEYAGPFTRMWEALPEALRAEGRWQAPDVFPGSGCHARRRRSHHRMLRSYARHDYPMVPAALNLNGREHVVDAGGGLGALADLLLEAYPELRVTVLDRPEVIDQARSTGESRRGIDWLARDLLQPWNLQADVVLLARVLHERDDDAARQILGHSRMALSKGGRLLVVEMLLPYGGVSGALCDLHLLMANGGRERTADEYRRLLEDAGFESRGVRSLPALPAVLEGVAR